MEDTIIEEAKKHVRSFISAEHAYRLERIYAEKKRQGEADVKQEVYDALMEQVIDQEFEKIK